LLEYSSSILFQNNYVVLDGDRLVNHLGFNSTQTSDFSLYWENLVQDQYMRDGGTYRYRRYGQFEIDEKARNLVVLPHAAYVQPSYINALNGDIERYFEPLEEGFYQSKLLQDLLFFMAQVYNHRLAEPQCWNVRLHPYRIIANIDRSGLPTPEGLHRDGVTFIASMMIQRRNIIGGMTTITDNQNNILQSVQLTNPFDLVMSDDANTMHHVSSIHPISPEASSPARDVLVIAFTKK
jgi:hypothetical protein